MVFTVFAFGVMPSSDASAPQALSRCRLRGARNCYLIDTYSLTVPAHGSPIRLSLIVMK